MHVVFSESWNYFFITGFLLQYLGNWYRTNGPLVNFTIFNTSNKNKAGNINSPWNLLVIIIFFFFKTIFILQNDYREAESCELQLESSPYSRIRDLMLDWINYISNYAFIKKSNINAVNIFSFFWLPTSMHKFYSHRPPSWLCQKTASLRVTVTCGYSCYPVTQTQSNKFAI